MPLWPDNTNAARPAQAKSTQNNINPSEKAVPIGDIVGSLLKQCIMRGYENGHISAEDAVDMIAEGGLKHL